MGIGYALGGIASGIQDTTKNILENKKLGAETALKTQAIAEAQQRSANQQAKNIQDQGNKLIEGHLKVIGDIIKHGSASGATPDQINGAVQPLLQDIDKLSAGIGTDPTPYHDQVSGMMAMPGESAPKIGSTIEGIKVKIAKGDKLTAGEQQLYTDAQKHMSLNDALAAGLISGLGAGGATPSAAAPSTPSVPGATGGGVSGIPPVPANLAGKGAQWSASKQRFYLNGSSYNQQGVAVP